jgi:hypothetical protein
MEINLNFQNKNIYSFEIEKDWHLLNTIDKETYIFIYAKNILNNFKDRLPKKYSLILFFYDVINNSIKEYEEKEEYEICYILLQIKNAVVDSVNRSKFGQINEKQSD